MRLLVIDGNSIINRAFYGIRLLSNKKGQFTNAIFGFINIYLKNFNDVKPDAVAVAFDLKAPTFRHKAYDKYKAGRHAMPDELFAQMQPTKDLLKSLGITIVECEGYEADDILGTLAKSCEKSGGECFIATGDRDSLQLVSDKITVRLASTKEVVIYTPEKINEIYGVNPEDLIEVKALMGDSSDNIPGVPGVGEKTALSLIKEYKKIENLYDNIETAKLTPSVKAKLENGKDSAFMSRMLATIAIDTPIDTNIENYKLGTVNESEAVSLLKELEMFSIISRLGLNENAVPTKEVPQQIEITDIKSDTFNISKLEDKTCDIYFDGNNGQIACECKIYTDIKNEDFLKLLESNIKKRTFDAKALYKYALQNEINIKNVIFDATLAAYLINATASDYSFSRLCSENNISYNSETEFSEISILPALCDRLSEKIENAGMSELLNKIEIPLAQVLSDMELRGFLADADGIKQFGEKIKADIEKYENEIYLLAGKNFNISSPKQLGEILFTELGLPAKKKTKSGYSTNADVLESLKNSHPIINLILEYRKLTKLNSTYIEGLLKVIGEDGRVHSVFKQTETRTGRISSTEPNLQNIPVKTELGKNMRKFFVAKRGCVLLDADYSQIELRVLAAISDDKLMQDAFEHGDDIHTITASQVFDLPLAFVDSSMRSAAKAVNFGIVYGIGAFSLSQDIGVSVSEADKYIKNYLENYSGVKQYMENIIEQGKKDGFVTTLFGRRRYIPELNSTNGNLRAFGARVARNTPIQGTAADIIKLAMVNVYNKLKEENLDAHLILQVHDELIVEASLKDAQRASEILQAEMENAADLKVKLIAEVGRGKNWYDAH